MNKSGSIFNLDLYKIDDFSVAIDTYMHSKEVPRMYYDSNALYGQRYETAFNNIYKNLSRYGITFKNNPFMCFDLFEHLIVFAYIKEHNLGLNVKEYLYSVVSNYMELLVKNEFVNDKSVEQLLNIAKRLGYAYHNLTINDLNDIGFPLLNWEWSTQTANRRRKLYIRHRNTDIIIYPELYSRHSICNIYEFESKEDTDQFIDDRIYLFDSIDKYIKESYSGLTRNHFYHYQDTFTRLGAPIPLEIGGLGWNI